ncbi:MAG: PilZ domain-containing protein [Acidobacteria bacterium]|nr:PilZ domain-containing protein [Acidobacteriota bacterium]
MTTWAVSTRNVQRAPRFALQLPVLFRRLGDEEWREGTTENVSRSGVLLRAVDALPERAAVEIRMALPAQIPGTQGASIICHAQVVRTAEPAPTEPGASPDSRAGYGAAICEYNLVPGFGE